MEFISHIFIVDEAHDIKMLRQLGKIRIFIRKMGSNGASETKSMDL